MPKNEITGDTIATRPYSDKYGDGYDRIWGKKEPEITAEQYNRLLQQVGPGQTINPLTGKPWPDPLR